LERKEKEEKVRRLSFKRFIGLYFLIIGLLYPAIFLVGQIANTNLSIMPLSIQGVGVDWKNVSSYVLLQLIVFFPFTIFDFFAYSYYNASGIVNSIQEYTGNIYFTNLILKLPDFCMSLALVVIGWGGGGGFHSFGIRSEWR
jgi:hypothetical protein